MCSYLGKMPTVLARYRGFLWFFPCQDGEGGAVS